ncbi:hypothetical protein EPUL_005843 [Erysiphe pulchra]|uniref:Uncharacterized protein n=1 Tax=Erysiphe pulchra TaxID=225359 RepID=A0A2S4PKX2_9PEZI|nr:hypothetical protein EPUL_005843 [Erysiphe pulchra]
MSCSTKCTISGNKANKSSWRRHDDQITSQRRAVASWRKFFKREWKELRNYEATPKACKNTIQRRKDGYVHAISLGKAGFVSSSGGQRVYVSAPDIPKSTPVPTNLTWAKIAASQDRADISSKKRNIKSFPPQGQSKEDRRVMIRLAPDHEARKSGTFEIRQTIQILDPDSSLAKSAIEERFGNATVERQETWTTFVIGPIQKQVRCLDGFCDPMDELLGEELAFVQKSVPIRYMNWTRRS